MAPESLTFYMPSICLKYHSSNCIPNYQLHIWLMKQKQLQIRWNSIKQICADWSGSSFRNTITYYIYLSYPILRVFQLICNRKYVKYKTRHRFFFLFNGLAPVCQFHWIYSGKKRGNNYTKPATKFRYKKTHLMGVNQSIQIVSQIEIFNMGYFQKAYMKWRKTARPKILAKEQYILDPQMAFTWKSC